MGPLRPEDFTKEEVGLLTCGNCTFEVKVDRHDYVTVDNGSRSVARRAEYVITTEDRTLAKKIADLIVEHNRRYSLAPQSGGATGPKPRRVITRNGV